MVVEASNNGQEQVTAVLCSSGVDSAVLVAHEGQDRVVKGWIDRELDHKMILRRDDPLLEPLQELGEPVFVVDHNPTVEQIAKLIFDQASEQGFSVVRVTVWETPTSFATYGALQRSNTKPKSEPTKPTLLR